MEEVEQIDQFEEVELSKHARERINGDRINIPETVVKQTVKQRKGVVYYDREEGSHLFISGRTVVAADLNGTKAIVKTVYRSQNKGNFAEE